MADVTSSIRYGIDSSPKWALLYSVQHVLTMLGATIAVPTLIGGAFGLTAAQQALLISNVLIAMGLATLLQTFVGTRLPIIQGSSFAFLPAMFLVSAYYSGAEGLQYMMGAVLVGGVFQALLGFSQLAGLLQRILSPVVVGPTIMAIGLSLFSAAAAQASASWPVALLTIALIFVIGFLMPRALGGRARFFETVGAFPVFITVVVLTGVAAIGTAIGVFGLESPMHFPFETIADADWLRSFSSLLMPWGPPRVDMAFLLVFLVAYLVSTIESLGDYNACSEIAEGDRTELSPDRANRGVMSEGIACAAASIIGAPPTTSYSENIGLIGLTGIASRRVVQFAAGVLIACGFIPVFGAVLASIPTPVMGGLYCVLFGMIAGVGLRYTAKADLRSMRNIGIIGFALFFGMVCQHYLGTEAGSSSLRGIIPASAFDIVFGVLSSSMAMTALSALILDLTIPAYPGERQRKGDDA